jgi:hypothetical protein
MENVEDDLPIDEPAEERSYTYREKALRDFFVKEYLVDYDAVAAAHRIGYGKSYAKEFSARFMQEPYVLRQIAKSEGFVNTESPEDRESAKRRIMAGLTREANYRGPGSSQAARVAALSKLAQLHGMDFDAKPKELDNNPAEGAFVVPGVMTPEQWAAAAEKQQEDLVNGVTAVMPAPPSIN